MFSEPDQSKTNLITLCCLSFVFTDRTHWQILPHSVWSHRPGVGHRLVPPQWPRHRQRLRGLHSDGNVCHTLDTWTPDWGDCNAHLLELISVEGRRAFIARGPAVVTRGWVQTSPSGLDYSNMCCSNQSWGMIFCLLSWGHWLQLSFPAYVLLWAVEGY